ncbi:MAG TPA: ATP phosphoribosyltransferase regulatory subunit [Bacillota bacterium]|nr:ATP phosphoribosyltransferase regulatory subunit [Bacillota bacterium]
MTKEQRQLKNNYQTLNKKYQQRYSMISRLNNRFETYGYEQIEIPTYESYDLYTSIKGTVHRQDMVKTIDPSGEVLVLRPDVTIPIMKKVSEQRHKQPTNVRYYYTLNVFRHSFGTGQNKERTQSGVELLGNDSIEADAELIALAVHNLRDLSLQNFKIELGHAQFLKILIDELHLSHDLYKDLKQLIHSKNMIELTPFLNKHVTDEKLKQAVQQIPLLYGQPEDVFHQAKDIVLNDTLQSYLQYLQNLYDILIDYGVSEHIVIDLGLVNHMDYYSGIIFQGFVHTVGKPVLMGGRYDELSKQFQANIPAIGFAIDIDTLLLSLPIINPTIKSNDIVITYVPSKRQESLSFASLLRDSNYRVITTEHPAENYRMKISINEDNIAVKQNGKTTYFQSTNDLYDWLSLRGKNIEFDNTRIGEGKDSKGYD